VAALIALAAVALLSVQPAAAAVGSETGTRTELTRCSSSPYRICLYYRGDGSGAYWGTGQAPGYGDGNLGNNYFVSGTGSGSGRVVRNAAAAMDCDYSVDLCATYVSPNYTGNWDYAYSSTGGTLYYTWNNGASIYYV